MYPESLLLLSQGEWCMEKKYFQIGFLLIHKFCDVPWLPDIA
jgi:hypothetical protein